MMFRMGHKPLRRRIAPRPTPRSSRRRPTIEVLEGRLVLSTVNWSGVGDGTSWNSPSNWVGGVVPGPGDDAVIDVGGNVTIQLPAGGIFVGSLKQTGGILVARSGTLATALGLTVTSGTLDDGGAITGPVVIDDATLDLTAASGAATFTIQGKSSIGGPIAANQTIVVQGTSTEQATATFAAGSSNAGTILLQPLAQGDKDGGLAVVPNSTFVNTGTVRVASSEPDGVLNGAPRQPGDRRGRRRSRALRRDRRKLGHGLHAGDQRFARRIGHPGFRGLHARRRWRVGQRVDPRQRRLVPDGQHDHPANDRRPSRRVDAARQ